MTRTYPEFDCNQHQYIIWRMSPETRLIAGSNLHFRIMSCFQSLKSMFPVFVSLFIPSWSFSGKIFRKQNEYYFKMNVLAICCVRNACRKFPSIQTFVTNRFIFESVIFVQCLVFYHYQSCVRPAHNFRIQGHLAFAVF